ncbi:MAG: DUF4856 domain-containing protein [Flavobacteriales bacterium]|nr:DUF4856 domain-containing protein [Flavobacteriales bacterium]
MPRLSNRILFVISISISSFILNSCNSDNGSDLDVPSIYNFTRNGSSTVDYSGQTERLDMLELMGTYMKSANAVGSAPLDANKLKDMFANQNDAFTGQTFAKDLRSKCFQNDVAMFESFMDELAIASQASGTAYSGTAGVLVDGSADSTIGYRVNANGIELRQVIIKGLMGAVFYYQAMEVYLSADGMGVVGNEDVENGENYTQMEHYFDEAFGYFGVPTDFPDLATVDDARFWGEYCNKTNGGLYSGMNDEVADAFRTARAAITARDYEIRDQAIQKIQDKWAIIAAASAVDYLSEGLSTSGTPNYKRHHEMSEGIGFLLALKYHFAGGNSKYPPNYTYSHIEDALAIVGPNTNLYNLTDQQIETAIEHIRMAFPSGEIQ